MIFCMSHHRMENVLNCIIVCDVFGVLFNFKMSMEDVLQASRVLSTILTVLIYSVG